MQAFAYLWATRLFANDINGLCDGDAGESGNCNPGLPKPPASGEQLQSILQIVFGLIGATAVIVIIIAGIQLATSNGDPQGLAKARTTILYAIVGLIVAVSAELIVLFVIKST